MTDIDPERIVTQQDLVAQLAQLYKRQTSGLAKFCRSAGLSPTTVQRIVRGGHELPKAETIEAFVRACGEDPLKWINARDRIAVYNYQSPRRLPVRNCMRIFLGRGWWQGVGAVIGTLSLFVAIFQIMPKSNPRVAEGGAESKNLSITPRPRFANIGLSWGITNPLFVGSVADLPEAPYFDKEYSASHCVWWEDFLSTDKRIYALDPSIVARLIADSSDVVSIYKIDLRILNRTRLQEPFVFIRCEYGAGGWEGYEAVLDTVKRTTHVWGSGSDKSSRMPPATITLKDGGVEGVLAHIDSRRGYLYDGILIIFANINGKDQELHLGDVANPLRWAVPDMPKYEPVYDWHPDKRKWVKVKSEPPMGW